jgi:hypothetical protein
MTTRVVKAKPLPFAEPPTFDEADIYAMKAMWAGIANPGQQQRAMKWILNAAARIDADPFRTDARLTDHLVGRQSVGRMILTLVNTIMPESK